MNGLVSLSQALPWAMLNDDDGTGKTPTSLSYKLYKSMDPMYNIQDGERKDSPLGSII